MIQVARDFIHQFRTVMRKTFGASRQAVQAAIVEFQASGNGLLIRALQDRTALCFWHPGAFQNDSLRLPATALDALDARGSADLNLEAVSKDKVAARWEDHGIRHEQNFDRPNKDFAFPSNPERFTSNDVRLLDALDQAMQCTATDGSRFAVQNVLLRGRRGDIAGTDGRHLLWQGGFKFGWAEDLLVPRVSTFGCDLGQPTSIDVAKVGEQLCFQIGSWTIWLPIDVNGRFPNVENVIPKADKITMRVEIANEDAAFLERTLPHLQPDVAHADAVTIDLNGRVLVRAREATDKPGTELVLARSAAKGKALSIALKRDHLARALHFGFRKLSVIEANMPVTFEDDNNKLVCMTISPTQPHNANDTCISSDSESTTNPPQPKRENAVKNRINTTPPVQPTTDSRFSGNGNGQVQNGNGQHNGNGHYPANGSEQTETNGQQEQKATGFNALLEEAQSLHNQLRDCLIRAGQLASNIKQYRRQAKTVQSTLATLRQLEGVEA